MNNNRTAKNEFEPADTAKGARSDARKSGQVEVIAPGDNSVGMVLTDPALFGGEQLQILKTVACELGIQPRELQTLIDEGHGPPYYRFGEKLIRFRPSFVRAWAAARVEISEPSKQSGRADRDIMEPCPTLAGKRPPEIVTP